MSVLNERRPDPDALLARVKEEEARQTRGKLKVFLGAAAGVGKTYAMLEAARARRSEGMDVVIGWVDTHGRVETEALLTGLEILARRPIEYRGTILTEFDLDAALARHPSLILVDELAHTNVPGSRHAKRWQDVQELLDDGINVYTTLNVQHLESLNDVVAQITTVRVRETIPDSVLEQADEVELVDLPPEELLQRLKEGKVYVPDQAQEAIRNFFRKGNLIALRELALRRTADRVDEQMQDYMRDHAITRTWPAAERILVCVRAGPLGVKLVRAARRMAARLRAEWLTVYVETPNHVRLSEADRPHRPSELPPIGRPGEPGGAPRRGLTLFATDGVHIDVAATPDQLVNHRAEEEVSPAGPRRFPHDDLADVSGASIRQDLLGDALAAEGNRLSSQLFGKAEGSRQSITVSL